MENLGKNFESQNESLGTKQLKDVYNKYVTVVKDGANQSANEYWAYANIKPKGMTPAEVGVDSPENFYNKIYKGDLFLAAVNYMIGEYSEVSEIRYEDLYENSYRIPELIAFYQDKRGLKVDGVIGKQTLGDMEKVYKEHFAESAKPALKTLKEEIGMPHVPKIEDKVKPKIEKIDSDTGVDIPRLDDDLLDVDVNKYRSNLEKSFMQYVTDLPQVKIETKVSDVKNIDLAKIDLSKLSLDDKKTLLVSSLYDAELPMVKMDKLAQDIKKNPEIRSGINLLLKDLVKTHNLEVGYVRNFNNFLNRYLNLSPGKDYQYVVNGELYNLVSVSRSLVGSVDKL